MTTTRLSNASKASTLAGLRILLNNVVGFVDCPLKDRTQFCHLWNAQFPQDLVDAVRVFGIHGMGMSAGISVEELHWGTVIDGVLHVALLNIRDLGPVLQDRMHNGDVQYALKFISHLHTQDFAREVNLGLNQWVYALEITPELMAKHLGQALTDEVLTWMKQCAIMRNELILANQTIQDVFGMAVTAGQIKRMVPDLLQYLPEHIRKAYEEQKRASNLPFEWAPYPKANIDVMMAAINKGHLLHGMRKPGREDHTVENIDNLTWARSDCTWQK